eukprot:5977611-Prymnesium_polylepis.2
MTDDFSSRSHAFWRALCISPSTDPCLLGCLESRPAARHVRPCSRPREIDPSHRCAQLTPRTAAPKLTPRTAAPI